ncbi:cytochrome c4 [Chitinibacter bivalviorum]|uniref:Cytochrome c4 n=1 Tax=Chitinibacter bivalviorum TaxID=2739434 RepID=A0A7H9BKP7_9NEIS|nr:c-type cytochrome [Chitinibacter bivalviorum]QLG88896.1 cytochrome c4 [Chitinibacter bivalviorum]
MRSMTVAVKLAALLMMTPAAFAAGAKADPAKGKIIVDQVCAACHGADGNSVVSANPSLAGQHPEYIVKQLTEFKAQKRKNPVMLGMATPLSNEDMANVAAYFSQQKPKDRGASNKELIEAGKKIYRAGVASKNVPACMACHGPAGAGIPGQYPRLSSQHGAYTVAQLTAFRNGERANNQPMMEIAGKLSDNEIKAVAEYIQSLH